jgi:hypothetical protein
VLENSVEAKVATPLRAGDRVRVRGRDEILATLDSDGAVDKLPFMPEMLPLAGSELTVQAIAHKTCDTIEMTGTTRRMEGTVHLAGARCDGSAHGGCQAGCLLFWRTEWLERIDGAPIDPPPARRHLPITPAGTNGSGPAAGGSAAGNGSAGNGSAGTGSAGTGSAGTGSAGTGSTGAGVAGDDLVRLASAGTDAKGRALYRCQATELVSASAPLGSMEPWQYLADVRTGNLPPTAVAGRLAVSLMNKYQALSKRLPARLRIHGGEKYPFYQGTGPLPGPEPLNLQPGELVEIKSRDEIMPMLDSENRSRGMWFDSEMLPYCGTRARVLRRVDKIIDEPSGRMIKLRDCIILESVVCTGRYNRGCPRAIYPYWRESWLRRVSG